MDEEQFEMWSDMIRSGQMEHMEVIQFLKDNPEFASWYVTNKVQDAFVGGDE